MRPAPQSRHLVAVLIFAAIAAAEGYLASVDDRLSDAQVNIATAAVKRHRPDAFAHDPIFGQVQYWRFHTPAFQALLELALVPTDYQDLRLPFRAMAGVLTMVFLCGMYALLYDQCLNWSVAAFVAVLSARVIETLGGGVWGIGSLESVTPTGMCLSVLPLIVLAFSRYARPEPGQAPSARWRVLIVFAAVGLLGNLHLVTAMNMTVFLLVAYVGVNRWRPRCLPVAAAAGLCALLAALPYAWYYFSLRAAMSRWEPQPPHAVVVAALEIGHLTALYPEVLKELLDWRMLGGGLVLAVPAATVLARWERFRAANSDLWAYLIFGAVFTAMGLHGLSQAAGWLAGTAPPVIDFLQAASLLLLPLYVLLAQAITNVFRMLRAHRTLVRWLLAALMAAWLIPSDNFRVVRHGAAAFVVGLVPAARSGGGAGLAEPTDAGRPPGAEPEGGGPERDRYLWNEYVTPLHEYVSRHQRQEAERAELEAIGLWAERRGGSVFLTDRGEFRMLARRPLLASSNDARYLYYLAPGRLGWWLHRYSRQQELLYPKAGIADGEAVAQFASDLIAEDASLKDVQEWYVILRAAVVPAKPSPLTAVAGDRWGQHYVLCRIR